MKTTMRQLVLALAFCFAVSPIAASAQTTHQVKKVKSHKVKAHKAPKVKKSSKRVVRHTAA
jgi:hypothetical protein